MCRSALTSSENQRRGSLKSPAFCATLARSMCVIVNGTERENEYNIHHTWSAAKLAVRPEALRAPAPPVGADHGARVTAFSPVFAHVVQI
jgi:hypothetical protein